MKKLFRKLLDFLRRVALKIVFVLGVLPCSAFCDGRRTFRGVPWLSALSLVGYVTFLIWTGSWPDDLGRIMIALLTLQAVVMVVWNRVAEWFWRRHREIFYAIQPNKEADRPKNNQASNATHDEKTSAESRFWAVFSLVITIIGFAVCLGFLIVLPALQGSEGLASIMGVCLVLYTGVMVAAILWAPLVRLAWLLRRQPNRFDEFFCQTTNDTREWILRLAKPYDDEDDELSESSQ